VCGCPRTKQVCATAVAEACQALRKAEESGWPASSPFLWGGALGNHQIVHGLPGDGLALTFHFPADVGDGVYGKLIGRPGVGRDCSADPGLAAIVTLDRELCRFVSVQFPQPRVGGLTAVPHQPIPHRP
jgi:hypothetical protein